MSNTEQKAFGVILTTGGSDTTIETESIQVFVTPHLPAYNLPARIFQRKAGKSAESWTEPSKSETEVNPRLRDDLVINEKGEIVRWTPEAMRILQARLMAVSAEYSGAYLVPLESEDIDALVNTAFPDLPESVIAKAIEIMETQA